ncbi:polysaccharide deacetylase family protein [Flexivirga alba]|uniref:Polysaccharide deacetylase family protein n=1 Tax=Flexivirga alba TaxID=702742 RepID=A0ABW2ALU2_9MICO
MQRSLNRPAEDPPPDGERLVGRRTAVVTGAAAIAAGLTACSTSGTSSATNQTASTSASNKAAPPSPQSSPAASKPSILTSDGPDIEAGPRTSRDIALTFHGAGPAGLVRQFLDLLKARRTPVTVFAVGTWAAANHDLLQRILTDGHDLGNHTWSHQPMRTLTAAQADTEVSRGAAAVAAVRHTAGPLFRPSGTPTSTPTIRAAARAAGYHRCISYDVDSLDYTDPGADAVVRNVLSTVRGGSIISLHFGHQGTLDALPTLLDSLTAKGFRPRTVTGLLAVSADPVVVTH